MRVLIIQPPDRGAVRSVFPQVEEGSEGIGYKPPLGILYVATTLRERSSHEVKVIDCVARNLGFDEIVEIAKSYNPDVVGVSAWTDFWYSAYTTGEKIKAVLPAAHLTYGGPHVSIYPQTTLDAPFVDSVIVGDGETPFVRLCEMIAAKKIENDVDGLHFSGSVVGATSAKFNIEKNLDDLPIPDRTLLPLEDYGSVVGKSDTVTTMITSRGCPFKCTFCKLNFQKCLCRSAASVVEEFKKIRELGVTEVEIYDDTFTWSKARVAEICAGLIDADLKMSWAIRDRVSAADPETLALMKKAGCTRIHYGVESGVDAVIARMKKNINTEEARTAVRWAKKEGFVVLTYFMLGNMDETREDMEQTIRFAMELNADYATFSIAIPYPGTEMYLEALEQGIIKSDFWLEFAKKPQPNFQIPQVIENRVSLNEMIHLRDTGVKKFYFRPSYIAMQLYKLRSWGELTRKAKMAFQLFKGLVEGGQSRVGSSS